jgi:hypothetical protein
MLSELMISSQRVMTYVYRGPKVFIYLLYYKKFMLILISLIDLQTTNQIIEVLYHLLYNIPFFHFCLQSNQFMFDKTRAEHRAVSGPKPPIREEPQAKISDAFPTI